MSEVEKYIEDGQVGVLVSGGYGAGWSTWDYNKDRPEGFMLMDKTLVQLCLSGASDGDVMDYFEAKDMEPPYMGGWSKCSVTYIDEGESFVIEEFDGAESIRTTDDLLFTA